MAPASKPTGTKPVETYRHDEKRANIPTNELRGFVEGVRADLGTCARGAVGGSARSARRLRRPRHQPHVCVERLRDALQGPACGAD